MMSLVSLLFVGSSLATPTPEAAAALATASAAGLLDSSAL